MGELKFKCSYEDCCLTRKKNQEKCKICKNNTKRNHMEDHFEEAKDKRIPRDHINATVHENCSAHSEGVDYECPICGGMTNSYASSKYCSHCGYPLFL